MSARAAMILAAGFGTRMGALTADRPKPLIEVAGRPLIDHALAALGPAAPLVVNGHYRAAQLRAHLDKAAPEAVFLEETPDILGSGGAIKNALPALGPDPVLTLNADAVWHGPAPTAILDAAWDRTKMDALMLLLPLTRAAGRKGGGDLSMRADGSLVWDRTDHGLVYTGAQIIATDAIAAHPDRVFSLHDIWQEMIDAGRLHGCLYPGRWADVGHPGGIAAAEEMLASAV